MQLVGMKTMPDEHRAWVSIVSGRGAQLHHAATRKDNGP